MWGASQTHHIWVPSTTHVGATGKKLYIKGRVLSRTKLPVAPSRPRYSLTSSREPPNLQGARGYHHTLSLPPAVSALFLLGPHHERHWNHPSVGSLEKSPYGAHSGNTPVPRLWKRGSHLPHLDPIHVPRPAGPHVWEAWGRTDHQAISAERQGHTRHGAPSHHIPCWWDPPWTPRGNPMGSTDAA